MVKRIIHLPGTEWNLNEKYESFVSRAKKLGIEHDMFSVLL